MGHHTDDLSPLRLRRANSIQDLLAHRRLVWKRLRRECLIDDDQILLRRTVFCRKGSAREQRRAHCFEVTGNNDLQIGSLKLAWISLSIRSAPTHRTKPARKR